MENKLTTSGVKGWNVEPASSIEQLMDVLFIAASGLKTQSLASPVLAEMVDVKARVDSFADEIHGLQADVQLPRK